MTQLTFFLGDCFSQKGDLVIVRHPRVAAPLSSAVVKDFLTDAKQYDRIAGYFSSSILEVAGEELEGDRVVGGRSAVRADCLQTVNSIHWM